MKYKYIFLPLVVLSLFVFIVMNLPTQQQTSNSNPMPLATEMTTSGSPSVQSAPNMQSTSKIESAIQENIQDAIEDYKYNMQFPPYSVPIKSSDWHVFNPRTLMDQPMTIMNGENIEKGPGKIQVSVVVDKGIVDIENDLPVRVSLTTVGEGKSPLKLSLVDIWVNPDVKSIRDVIAPAVKLSSRKAGSNAVGGVEFYGSIPSSTLRQHVGSDVYVVAGFTLSDNSQGKAFVPISLFKSKAAIKSIGKAYVDGVHLMIPFELLAYVPGGFNVRATLLDDTGKVPIALVSESIRAESIGLLRSAFRVHIATLKEKGDEGPYVLTNINITKTLTKPDYQSGFGTYDDSRHTISGFSFDKYSDEVYVDKEMQRRLQGLEKMADKEQ